jgi:hypothetical protein
MSCIFTIFDVPLVDNHQSAIVRFRRVLGRFARAVEGQWCDESAVAFSLDFPS